MPPLDDLHPIVREAVLQGDEAVKVGTDTWARLMTDHGIVDLAAQKAILRLVNVTGAAMAQGEGRRFKNQDLIACHIMNTLLLGVRLVRKGLV